MIISDQDLLQIALVSGLSILSGIGAYLHGCRAGRYQVRALDFVGEMSCALTAGLMVFYLAKHNGLDDYLIYFAVLLSSNNGSEVLDKARSAIADKVAVVISGLFSKGDRQ